MFEEYIKNGTPEQKERAENWQIAIGLQDVDNLKAVSYTHLLQEKARQGIQQKSEQSYPSMVQAVLVISIRKIMLQY